MELKFTASTWPELLEQLRTMITEAAAQPPKQTKPAKVSAPTGSTQEAAATAPDSSPEPEALADPETSAYTLEQVRAKGLDAARAHGQPAVKAILTELGAANMGSLKTAQFAAFMAALEGLNGA